MGGNQQRSVTDSVRTTADLGIPETPVSGILTQDLDTKGITAKFVLWLLLPEQKEHHATAANDFIQTATNEPDFFKKVKT